MYAIIDILNIRHGVRYTEMRPGLWLILDPETTQDLTLEQLTGNAVIKATTGDEIVCAIRGSDCRHHVFAAYLGEITLPFNAVGGRVSMCI